MVVKALKPFNVTDGDDDNDEKSGLQNEEGKSNPPLATTIASIAGNVLEWYDFAVFGFFAETIADVFFPNGKYALLKTFGLFGGAFLMRPIGGVLMGWIGDRYGRKFALEMSIFLMAFPTFAMGCIPSYNDAGMISVILLIAVRLLQGLSVGGQLVSSLVYTLEQNNHRKDRWGLLGSYVMSAACFGTLLGTVVAAILQSTLSPDDLLSFGWRIPFLSGILVVFCGCYLRKHGTEDNFHVTASTNNEDAPANPITMALRSGRVLLSACFIPMLWSGGFYVNFVWMPTYYKTILDPPIPSPFWINSFSLLLSVCLAFPFCGLLSDWVGRERIMIVGALSFSCMAPITFVTIANVAQSGTDTSKVLVAFTFQSLLGLCTSLWGAPMLAWLVESFEPDARLTSVAIGFNVGHAIVGGMSPLVETIIASGDVTGSLNTGLYLTFIGLVSLFGLVCIYPRNQQKEKQEKAQQQISYEDTNTPYSNMT